MGKYTDPSRRVEQVASYLLGDVAVTTDELPCFMAPFQCEILSVHFVNRSDITANDTNYFTFAVKNKGSGGTGTAAVCSVNTKITGGSGNVTGHDAQSLGTISNGLFQKGDTASITVTKTLSPTDLADCMLYIRYREI